MDATGPLLRALQDYQQTIDILLGQITSLTAELAQVKEAHNHERGTDKDGDLDPCRSSAI